jgi:putative oxidoreductase
MSWFIYRTGLHTDICTSSIIHLITMNTTASFVHRMLSTGDSIVPFILRLTAGIVMFPHGAQMMLGWFGGGGFDGTMHYLTGMQHLPWIAGFMVIMIQFFGSLLLVAGLATRAAALGMGIIFTGMIFSGHIEHGFFINWSGTQQGEGFEYHLLMLGICTSLIYAGGGRFSADRLLATRS